MPEGITGPDLLAKDAAALGSQFRQDAHRLNNLLLVVQGNIELLSLEHTGDGAEFQDIMLALKECREIAGRFLDAARRLSGVR